MSELETAAHRREPSDDERGRLGQMDALRAALETERKKSDEWVGVFGVLTVSEVGQIALDAWAERDAALRRVEKLRKSLERLGGTAMVVKAENTPEFMAHLASRIAEADRVLAETAPASSSSVQPPDEHGAGS